jgi:hypothetical protein
MSTVGLVTEQGGSEMSTRKRVYTNNNKSKVKVVLVLQQERES